MSDRNVDKSTERVTQAAGALSGNKRLENERRADRAKGAIKDAADRAADKLSGSKKH